MDVPDGTCGTAVSKSHPRLMEDIYEETRNRTGERSVGLGHQIISRRVRKRPDFHEMEDGQAGLVSKSGHRNQRREQERKKKGEDAPQFEDEAKDEIIQEDSLAQYKDAPRPRHATIMREDVRKADITEGCLGCKATVSGGNVGAHWPLMQKET